MVGSLVRGIGGVEKYGVKEDWERKGGGREGGREEERKGMRLGGRVKKRGRK